jgi:hypothetical protein
VTQIEALEQVERLGLWTSEVVPSVLPPEAFKAGIEIIDRQIILSAGAPDFVISLEGTAEGCADARRGKSGAKPAATTESRDRVHMN